MAPLSARPMRTHRFALSISGGIALGSYEAGVLTQLYRDLHAFNRDARIKGKAQVSMDAIAGASAGSITGLILAQALSLGLPPAVLESRMRACWVDLLNIEDLLQSSAEDTKQALFTDSVVQRIVQDSVDHDPQTPLEEQEEVALWITMTNLDGVPYVIDFERKDHRQPGKPPHVQPATQLYALDYRDYIPFVLKGEQISLLEPRMTHPPLADGRPRSRWQDAIDAARASSAFPIAFPSQYQQRDLREYPEYMKFKDEVETDELPVKSKQPELKPTGPLPTTAWFQFVDGGLFNNEPIGKCIDAVEALNSRWPRRDPHSPESQGRAGRSFIIIEPEPQLPQDVERSLMVSTQRSDKPTLPFAVLSKILSAYFNSALYGDFANVANINARILALDTALAQLDTLGLDASQAEKVADMKTAIRKAVGLDGKTQITLQRIPAELPTKPRLAGAFAGHFGGFLRRDFREADFITGQYEARHWLTQWLTEWLQNHADDVEIALPNITATLVRDLLGKAPPDPADAPIEPTKLTPAQLAQAGWFPARKDGQAATATARLAALTPEERQKIVQLAEARAESLLDAWLGVSPLAHCGVHIAAYALGHLFSGHFIDEPA